jgi:hypothetical protein
MHERSTSLAPRHEGVDSALTRDDVAVGVSFVTYIPGQEVLYRGLFTSGASYDEDDPRWTATGLINNEERTLYLFDMGITPDHDGITWAPAVTITEDL